MKSLRYWLSIFLLFALLPACNQSSSEDNEQSNKRKSLIVLKEFRMANEAALVTVLDGYTNGNIKVAEHVLLDYVAYLESELGKLQDSNSAISEAHSYLALSYERLSRIYKYLGASEKMTKYINKRDHIIESSLKTGEKNNQNSYLKISKVVTFLDREYGLPWILPTDESLPSE